MAKKGNSAKSSLPPVEYACRKMNYLGAPDCILRVPKNRLSVRYDGESHDRSRSLSELVAERMPCGESFPRKWISRAPLLISKRKSSH